MSAIPELRLETGLPADLNAEKTILASILLDNEYFFDDSLELEAEDFSLDSHRRIYLRMSEMLYGMVEGVRHVDIVTLSNELSRQKEIEAVGGWAYLASLTEGVPRNLRVHEYARIIKEKRRLRQAILLFSNGIARAADQGESSLDLIGNVQEQLADIVGQGSSGAVRIGSITPTIEGNVNRKRTISNERTALEMTWGLSGLDEKTHGCFRGEFTVIGGESSGGKTALAVQIAIDNAREGTPVVIYSLEMTKEALTQRFYPSMSEVLTNNHLRDPRLMNTGTHIPEMNKISRELAHLPIDIDDSPVRIDKLRGRIKAMVRKWKKEISCDKMLVLVDYLQLIKGMPGMSGVEQFANTLFILRDIPKEVPEIHLAVLSQYSQGDKFTKKASSRTKDSLYGGSVIHHAAQNVFMVAVEDPEKRDAADLLDAEIKIAKQREGARTKVTCCFDRDHLRFCYAQRQM